MTPHDMMAFEPPPPSPINKATRTSWRGRKAQPPDITPARAIAEAWIRETKESQNKWREADARLKNLFNHPNRQVPPGRRAKM
ncbi:hypothetical protein B0F90DRAFT_1697705 [Multifurca ochricompacta]|uniref:Uncharacterized protein n=1 Tax=Multifurca ochricompacta TaxID=376703 RepID=A0AAD4M890_9AGAM|nr:hypothetical protein B0F90DRAFT_1697705 [Multifurca ochricompacta]